MSDDRNTDIRNSQTARKTTRKKKKNKKNTDFSSTFVLHNIRGRFKLYSGCVFNMKTTRMSAFHYPSGFSCSMVTKILSCGLEKV